MKAMPWSQWALVAAVGFWLAVPAVPAWAGVDIHVGIGLPPLVVFPAPPVAVVLPGLAGYDALLEGVQ